MSSSFSGAGVSPFGVGPYGYGTPATTTTPSGTTLQGEQGKQFGSRLIGYGPDNRGQYVFDENGMVEGQSNARQLVYLAIATELGSSVIGKLGRGRKPPKIGANFAQETEEQIRAALADLVDKRIVQIDSVTVLQDYQGRTFTRVEITDLTTQQPITLKI